MAINLFPDYVLRSKRRNDADTYAFSMFIYELIIETKAQVIVEIGTYKGRSTRIILSALHTLAMNGFDPGKLYSVDVLDCSGVIPSDSPLYPYWQFNRVNSREFYKTFNQKIDILLIDGDHQYKSTKDDYDNYEPLVRHNGYILMHDTKTSQGTSRFWDSNDIKYPRVELDWQHGLGVIQKKLNH